MTAWWIAKALENTGFLSLPALSIGVICGLKPLFDPP
jgi:hypothetical protein